MNWGRIIGGGVAAGIVTWLADFAMHRVLMAEEYKRLSGVFTQTEANPMSFLAISVVVGVFVALLFAKTRASWAAGWKGGSTFGLYLGLAMFFMNFYYPLVLDGFPYYLGWCWGGIGVIDGILGGAALGAIVRRD